MTMTDAQAIEYQNGIVAYYRLYLTDRENLKLPENAGESRPERSALRDPVDSEGVNA
jgi:hypothetical protein